MERILIPDRGGRRSFGEPRGRASPGRSFGRDDVANLIICILADYTERRSQGSRRGGCEARTPFTFAYFVDEPIGATVHPPIAGSRPRNLLPSPSSNRREISTFSLSFFQSSPSLLIIRWLIFHQYRVSCCHPGIF